MKDLLLKTITDQHFDFIIKKRTDSIVETYSNSNDLLVFVEGPRWSTVGYENVSKGWRDFVGSDIELQKCEWVENLTSKVGGDMGFVAGIVELQVKIKNELKTIRFRGTFVFERQTNGDWRIIHEHFSQPATDPYGIGDWLKKG